MQSARYSCQILMKLEFSRQIFEKYTKVKFHENPSNRRIFMKYDTELGILKTTLINVTVTNSSDVSDIHYNFRRQHSIFKLPSSRLGVCCYCR
jgi:hypothetical protein